MTTVREVIGRQPETAFQKQVIDLARLCRWRVAHFRSVLVQHKDGRASYQTPVQADGAGFPDLVLVRERVLYRELKAEKGTLDAEQKEWLASLKAAGQDADVWRPSDFPRIVEELA